MPNRINIPYGNTHLTYKFSDDRIFDQILPNDNLVSRKQEFEIIENSLQNCIGFEENKLFNHSGLLVAIAINDSTRPTPNKLLLPPLLKKIASFGIPPENISLFIATGTHRRPSKREIFNILSLDNAVQYRVIAHNCDDSTNLAFIGHSTTGTPIFINKDYFLHE
jgi:nickel-dependent lactate racemase